MNPFPFPSRKQVPWQFVGPWKRPVEPVAAAGHPVEIEGPLPRGVHGEFVQPPTITPEDYFEALNGLWAQECLHLSFGQDCPEDTVIVLLHAQVEGGESSLYPRVSVTLAPGVQGHLVEIFRGQEGIYGRYGVTSLSLGQESSFTHTKIQRESLRAQHYGKLLVHLDQGASFKSFTLSCGGGVVRHNIHLYLEGEGAKGGLYGAFPLGQGQHGDHFVEVHHRASHTESRQLFKGILSGKSHGAFSGNILVSRGVRGVDASQLSKTLLLSPKARIFTKPELEIDADDVRCSHGATVGQLEEEEIFYLMARGIPRELARRLLSLAFAREIITEQDCPRARQFLEDGLESQVF